MDNVKTKTVIRQLFSLLPVDMHERLLFDHYTKKLTTMKAIVLFIVAQLKRWSSYSEMNIFAPNLNCKSCCSWKVLAALNYPGNSTRFRRSCWSGSFCTWHRMQNNALRLVRGIRIRSGNCTSSILPRYDYRFNSEVGHR
jgi:hypothetical protein